MGEKIAAAISRFCWATPPAAEKAASVYLA
jgi:hypothetical protein